MNLNIKLNLLIIVLTIGYVKAQEKPDFMVNSYAFYPKDKKIAYAKTEVSMYSSSGIGRLYYAEIGHLDYDSFEILDADRAFAKDKNTYYLQGDALNLKPDSDQKIILDKDYNTLRIIMADGVWVWRLGLGKLDKYQHYKPLGEVVYQHNDSLFLFDEGTMKSIKNPVFDTGSLQHLEGRLYQDHKNLYLIYKDEILTMEDEQIVRRHFFKDVPAYYDGLTVFIGQKNFYNFNSKLFNYKLHDYHFIPESKYYVYNGCLYFMDGFSFLPLGITSKSVIKFNQFEQGLNDPDAMQVNVAKAKALAADVLVYGDDKLYKDKYLIGVPPEMKLSQLKYLGVLPEELRRVLEEHLDKQYTMYPDLYAYNDDYYVVYRDSLIRVDSTEVKLNSFRWLNEHYYIYKNTLFGLGQNFNNQPKTNLTGKQIDFSKLKVFGKYFSDGKGLWYGYKKTDPDRNNELSEIAFEKLRGIDHTEYVTDGVYLIFRGNIIGKIKEDTLHVLGLNYLEDASQYFFENYAITKKALKNGSDFK